MVTRTASENSHKRTPRRAPAHAAHATPRTRRAKTQATNRIGRLIGYGALALLGTVVVLGAGSLIALLAGYEPAGYEAEARRLRRFALDHRPELPKNINLDALQPVGRQIGRSEHWLADKVRDIVG